MVTKNRVKRPTMEGWLLCVKVLSSQGGSWKQMRWSGKQAKRRRAAGWQSLLFVASHLAGNLGCTDRFRHRFAIKSVLARRKSMQFRSVAFLFLLFSFSLFLSLFFPFFLKLFSSFFLNFASFFVGFYLDHHTCPFRVFHHFSFK